MVDGFYRNKVQIEETFRNLKRGHMDIKKIRLKRFSDFPIRGNIRSEEKTLHTFYPNQMGLHLTICSTKKKASFGEIDLKP